MLGSQPKCTQYEDTYNNNNNNNNNDNEMRIFNFKYVYDTSNMNIFQSG
jgi:hypothetical protein